jgi:hypothetical protein
MLNRDRKDLDQLARVLETIAEAVRFPGEWVVYKDAGLGMGTKDPLLEVLHGLNLTSIDVRTDTHAAYIRYVLR